MLRSMVFPATRIFRIGSLPRDLDHPFTHVLTKRITPRQRTQAYRYLLIALEWERHSHRAYAQLELSPSIVAIATRASDYQEACSLAMLPLCETQKAVKDFPHRLKDRCRGLLEVQLEREHGHGSIQFLHRTLFDYLNERTEIIDSLARGAGDGFQVHVAIMASLACIERREPAPKRRRPSSVSNHKLKDWWTKERRPRYIDTFFLFSASAEVATRWHTTELISIFDRIMLTRFEAIEGSLTTAAVISATDFACNWFDDDPSGEYTQIVDNDLFGHVVRMDGTLHLSVKQYANPRLRALRNSLRCFTTHCIFLTESSSESRSCLTSVLPRCCWSTE